MTREPRQSLTVVVEVADATSCAVALGQSRRALEAAFAELAGLHTACLALLPAGPGASESALFFECLFEGSLLEMLGALLGLAAPEVREVFAHCAGFPEPLEARSFARFLAARASRASAYADSASPPVQLDLWERARRIVAAHCHWPMKSVQIALDPSELERRRGAVGMQDWQPGVPLLHVARLPDDARARAHVRRTLRAIELEQAPRQLAARFVLHGQWLLFLAYPAQNAQLWTEQVSRSALASLTRIWASAPEFRGRRWLPRKRRVRHLQRFLLDGRAPVAAWFNAQARLRAV
jgi:hypothetical protein